MLIVLVLAAQALLRGKLAPRWRYALWLLVMVRLMLPWAPESPVSVYNLPLFLRHFVVMTASPAHDMGTTEFPMPALVQGEELRTGPSEAPPPVIAQSVQRERRSLLSLVPVSLGVLLSLVWLAGAVVLAGFVLGQSIFLARTVRQRRSLTDPRVLDVLEECKEQMGVSAYLAVVETDRVRSPALLGLIRPRLLLPAGAPDALGPDRLRHVFLHELAHLRRHDVAINWLMTLLQVLHWFNPLVWYAFGRMRADREMACDALALSHARPGESLEYGRTIVHLLENFSQTRRLPNLAGILENQNQMKRRIAMIARFRKNPKRWPLPALALIVLLGAAALTNAQQDSMTPAEARELASSAKEFIELLDQRDFAKAERLFDAAVKKALPEAKLKETWDALLKESGPFGKVTGYRVERFLSKRIVLVRSEFQNGPLDAKIVYNAQKKITGLWFVPTAVGPEYRSLADLDTSQSFGDLQTRTYAIRKEIGPEAKALVEAILCADKASSDSKSSVTLVEGTKLIVHASARQLLEIELLIAPVCDLNHENKTTDISVATFVIVVRDDLLENPELSKKLFNLVVEVIETMLYAEEGKEKASAQGRRLWVDPLLKQITITDRSDRIATVSSYLQSLPQLVQPERRETVFLKHLDVRSGLQEIEQLLGLAPQAGAMSTGEQEITLSANQEKKVGPLTLRLRRVNANNASSELDDTCALLVNTPTGSATVVLDESGPARSVEDWRLQALDVRPTGGGGEGATSGGTTTGSGDGLARIRISYPPAGAREPGGMMGQQGATLTGTGQAEYSLAPFGKQNALVVTYTDPADLERVRQVIAELDKPGKKEDMETKKDAGDLAIEKFRILPYKEGGLYSLVVSIRNKGSLSRPGVKVHFYRGAPDKGGEQIRDAENWAGPIKPRELFNEMSLPFALKDGVNEFTVALGEENKTSGTKGTVKRQTLKVTVKEGKIVEEQEGNSTPERTAAESSHIPATSTINAEGRIVDKLDYPFVDDPAMIGAWKSVDLVAEPEQFKPGQRQFPGDPPVKEFVILPDGKTSKPWETWTKGMIFHSGDRTAGRYDLKELDGSTYMFLERKDGRYLILHAKPNYYVLRKEPFDTGGLAEAWAALPSDEEFRRSFPEKIAQLDIDTANLDRVIEVLGKPAQILRKYQYHPDPRDYQPPRYDIIYPDGFSILMTNNKIIELRYNKPGYFFRDKLQVGSTLEDVLKVVGEPKETVEGKKRKGHENEFKDTDGVLYKDMDGEKGRCYYARPDQKVRFIFVDNKVCALYVTSSLYVTLSEGKGETPSR